MAVIVPAKALLSSLPRSRTAAMSVLPRVTSIQAMPSASTTASQKQQSDNVSGHDLEDEKRHAAHLVKALAERYGQRAVQRWSTEGDEQSGSATSPTSAGIAAFGTSPSGSTYRPFSSTWAARYWQLQKTKAEQMLAELERSSKDKNPAQNPNSSEETTA